MSALLLLVPVLFIAAFLRFIWILPNGKPTKRNSQSLRSTYSVAVFLGSGGHTSEALQLLSGLDFSRYTSRTYVISQGDILSERKALELERTKGDTV